MKSKLKCWCHSHSLLKKDHTACGTLDKIRQVQRLTRCTCGYFQTICIRLSFLFLFIVKDVFGLWGRVSVKGLGNQVFSAKRPFLFMCSAKEIKETAFFFFYNFP